MRVMSRSTVALSCAHGVLLAALAIVIHIARQRGVEVGDLTRDPNYLAGSPFYSGALSNFGVLAWSSGGTAALFAAVVLSTRGASAVSAGRLLGAAGLLSWMLALDDLYMIHEIVAPRYLGIPQAIVLGAYATAGLVWAVSFRRRILRRDALFLAWAIGLLTASAVIDQMRDHWDVLSVGLEDGLKLAGATAWCLWMCRVAHVEMMREMKVARILPRSRDVFCEAASAQRAFPSVVASFRRTQKAMAHG